MVSVAQGTKATKIVGEIPLSSPDGLLKAEVEVNTGSKGRRKSPRVSVEVIPITQILINQPHLLRLQQLIHLLLVAI